MADDLIIHGIPLFLVIITVATFIVTYLWSVANNHVSSVFPSISDTGAFPPESCLFSETANIAAVLMALTIYFRYLVLRDFAYVKRLKGFSWLIRINVFLGMVVAVGVSLVGNYQSITVSPLHYLGAFLLFGLGGVYMLIDVILSYCTAIFPHQRRGMCHFRAVLTGLVVCVLILMIVAGSISSDRRQDWSNDPMYWLIWQPGDGGYAGHVTSNISEWIIGLAELTYFATFAQEFRQFRMAFPRLYPAEAGTTLRQPSPVDSKDSGGGGSGGSGGDRESEPLLQSKAKQFLYIGTGDTV